MTAQTYTHYTKPNRVTVPVVRPVDKIVERQCNTRGNGNSTGTPITIHCDGLCDINPGGIATWGYVAEVDGMEYTPSGVVGEGEGMTNNVAEYHAVIHALKWVERSGYKGRKIRMFTDSQLVVKQLTNQWDVKAENLLPLWTEAKGLLRQIGHVDLRWCPREENEKADAMSRIAYEAHQRNAQ